MKLVFVRLPEPMVEALDVLCGEDGMYPSRSEAIRQAVRAFIEKEGVEKDA